VPSDVPPILFSLLMLAVLGMAMMMFTLLDRCEPGGTVDWMVFRNEPSAEPETSKLGD
jgi:hypothetical protein